MREDELIIEADLRRALDARHLIWLEDQKKIKQLTAACRAALAILEAWPPSEWGYREHEMHDILSAALTPPAAGGVGEQT